MKALKALPSIIRIAKYTLIDEVRQKSFVIMFILHSIVFLISSINLKVFMPEYLAASLLCSV
ncbi:MAG: hypothetical protein WCO89_10245, partial [Syntrophus sp. (in: bacteria)]